MVDDVESEVVKDVVVTAGKVEKEDDGAGAGDEDAKFVKEVDDDGADPTETKADDVDPPILARDVSRTSSLSIFSCVSGTATWDMDDEDGATGRTDAIVTKWGRTDEEEGREVDNDDDEVEVEDEDEDEDAGTFSWSPSTSVDEAGLLVGGAETYT